MVYERVGKLPLELPRLLIEEAGHAVHIQQGDRVNAAILAFLSSPPTWEHGAPPVLTPGIQGR